MGLTFNNNNKRQRIIKDNPSKKLFISTGTPTHRPEDGNKFPNLLDFFVTNEITSTYTDILSSYDITSIHSTITATLSTSLIARKQTPRWHN
jgi:hypothetical protein